MLGIIEDYIFGILDQLRKEVTSKVTDPLEKLFSLFSKFSVLGAANKIMFSNSRAMVMDYVNNKWPRFG